MQQSSRAIYKEAILRKFSTLGHASTCLILHDDENGDWTASRIANASQTESWIVCHLMSLMAEIRIILSIIFWAYSPVFSVFTDYSASCLQPRRKRNMP